MKLSGQSQNHRTNDALDVIRSFAQVGIQYWKAIEPSEDIAQQIVESGMKLIVRVDFEQPGDDPSWKDRFLDTVKNRPWFKYAWAVETANEPYSGEPDVPEWFSQAEAEIANELWYDHGTIAIVGNRATGHDGYYVPVNENVPLYIGIHEYGYPRILDQQPWNALRHQSWFPSILEQRPDAKLLFTEVGISKILVGGEDLGFKETGLGDEDFFYNSLIPFNQIIESEDYVEVAFIYGIGMLHDDESDKPWSTHDCLDTTVPQRIIDFLAQAPQMEQETQ